MRSLQFQLWLWADPTTVGGRRHADFSRIFGYFLGAGDPSTRGPAPGLELLTTEATEKEEEEEEPQIYADLHRFEEALLVWDARTESTSAVPASLIDIRDILAFGNRNLLLCFSMTSVPLWWQRKRKRNRRLTQISRGLVVWQQLIRHRAGRQ